MTKLTESAIENFAIELLEEQGYQYIYGPDIAPDSEILERSSFEDTLLLERLKNTVSRINPTIPEDAREDAIRQIRRISSPDPVPDMQMLATETVLKQAELIAEELTNGR